MKKLLLIPIIPILLLSLGLVGCSNDENIVEVSIVKELPKLITIGSNTNSVVIQSREELEAIYTAEVRNAIYNAEELTLINDLLQIDFSKYTLLLGYGTYGNQVTNMEHSFTKTGSSTYTYLFKVAGDATMPDVFRYGILVEKLPASTVVTFEIKEL
jgi:hypothetical protein